MLLSVVPFGELTKLFQILLIIMLSILAFSVLFTVLIHYRRRRTKQCIPDDEDLHHYIAESSPEKFWYKANDGTLIYLDHTGLLKEYRNKLSYSHARYAALQQDFNRLESGFTGSFYSNKTKSNYIKKIVMENTELQVQLTDENILNENSIPDKQLKDHEYLNDLLAEKKRQIEFLQNQIDLRIKNFHYSEKEKGEIKSKLEESEQTRNKIEVELESLRKHLVESQQEIDNLSTSLEEKQGRLTEAGQILDTKRDQIIYMESVLLDVNNQNQLLNAAAADAEDKYKALEQQLQANESKFIAMEQKLLANKRMLQRLYNEFAATMQEEAEMSPVIHLRPEHINSEWEETAMQ